MGSKSHSQSTSQATSQQALDPQIKGALLGNYGDTQSLVANTPSQYTGQLVAGFTPAQQQAQAGLIGLGSSNTGNAALDAATSAAGGASGYNPSSVTANSLPNVDLTRYMNPFTQSVVQSTMAELNQQNALANQANDASATSAGAFGGDRSAVLDALTNGQYGLAAGQTLAGLNQANYANAQGAAQTDIANNLAAQQANQQAGLNSAGLRLQAANSLGALSGQQVSQAAQKIGLVGAAGQQQQQQAQNALTAQQQQFQTNLGNKVTLQQLINQALGLAGNPVLGSSQSTGNSSSNSFAITPPNVSISGAGG